MLCLEPPCLFPALFFHLVHLMHEWSAGHTARVVVATNPCFFALSIGVEVVAAHSAVTAIPSKTFQTPGCGFLTRVVVFAVAFAGGELLAGCCWLSHFTHVLNCSLLRDQVVSCACPSTLSWVIADSRTRCQSLRRDGEVYLASVCCQEFIDAVTNTRIVAGLHGRANFWQSIQIEGRTLYFALQQLHYTSMRIGVMGSVISMLSGCIITLCCAHLASMK